MEAKKNLIVGLFVGGTLLLFAIGLFLIGNSTQLFSNSFEVYADFSKVTGIQIRAKVRVAGHGRRRSYGNRSSTEARRQVPCAISYR